MAGPSPCRKAGRRAGPGLEPANHSGSSEKERAAAPISTPSRGLAEQLATVVATFFESWVSREIPGGDRARPWLEVFARVASAWGLPGREPHCRERRARERPLAGILRRWSAGTRGDPEGQGTLGAPGGRSPCWAALSQLSPLFLDAWEPVVQLVSTELAYPLCLSSWET